MSFSSNLYKKSPVFSANSRFLESTAGIEAVPGIHIPSASMAEAIVLAVNIPEQAPPPGQEGAPGAPGAAGPPPEGGAPQPEPGE